MTLARRELAELFPSICFAPEQETEPLSFRNPALFSNQVAIFSTSMDETRIYEALKNIERLSGRLPEDKELEKVCLDIDLLAYDDRILKPEDWQRNYIQQELAMLHYPLSNKEL